MSVQGRGQRVTFLPLRPEPGHGIKGEPMVKYITKVSNESLRYLTNWPKPEEDLKKLEAYSVSTSKRGSWFTCPCNSAMCPQTFEQRIVVGPRKTCKMQNVDTHILTSLFSR